MSAEYMMPPMRGVAIESAQTCQIVTLEPGDATKYQFIIWSLRMGDRIYIRGTGEAAGSQVQMWASKEDIKMLVDSIRTGLKWPEEYMLHPIVEKYRNLLIGSLNPWTLGAALLAACMLYMPDQMYTSKSAYKD